MHLFEFRVREIITNPFYEVVQSPMVHIGLALGSLYLGKPAASLTCALLIGSWERSRLVRELAALFFSHYYPLPNLSSSYQIKKEGDHEYSVQHPRQEKSYIPVWGKGRFFLDRVVTLENGARIFIGALPHRVHAQWLQEQDCAVVISMIEKKEYDIPRVFSHILKPEDWASFSIKHYHFPTPDFTPLSQDVLRHSSTQTLAALKAGKSVYIHCKAGRGRSAAVVVAALCQLFEKSVDEAVTILCKSRSQVTLDTDQLAPIREFIRTVENSVDSAR